MSFQYPLGLLGLIAIPVLILIYILKNKHTEQVISSTYLWTLSERFLKRKNPISRLTSIISLILQILVVALISFASAHPVFTLKNAADDHVFILDASGSMTYEMDGKARFDLAKEEIVERIEDSVNGSTYTLITVGETTGVVFEGVEDKKLATSLLEKEKVAAVAPTFASAKGLAQEYFALNPSSLVYLITDKSYDSLENVELINVASKEENYAVANLKQYVEGGKLVVIGEAYSYESDRELTLALEVVKDGQRTAEAEQVLSVKKLEGATFRFEVETTEFDSIRVAVMEEDSQPLDNESMLHTLSGTQAKKVLLVSEDPFFLERAFSSLSDPPQLTVVNREEYENMTTSYGYGLYVFEGYTPEILPDGAVWFINPQKSLTNAGFKVQGNVSLASPALLKYSTSTATRVESILKGTVKSNIYLKEYVKCSFDRNFSTVLSYDGNPVLFAGLNDNKKREVVFAFDFHKSDFILTVNYITIIRNLLEYTFPSMVDQTAYECGAPFAINVLSDSKSVRIDTPTGDIVNFGAENDFVEYTLTEVGTYKITQIIGEEVKSVYVYGNLPMSERASIVNEAEFSLSGTPSSERRDGRYEDLMILFILLALLFIADWGVYCYEQYQLR